MRWCGRSAGATGKYIGFSIISPRLPPPDLRTLMRKTPVIVAFAVITACLTSGVHAADQSPQEATALLTSGKWDFDGDGIMRRFQPDGTFSSTSGSKGTWSITGNEMVMVFSHKNVYRFPLPIELDGTRGVNINPADTEGLHEGKPVTIIRERSPFDCAIVDATGASVTISVGKTGDVDLQQTYKIADSTAVTVDGQDDPGRTLKAGMRANIKLMGDGVVIMWIHAKDPKKH